MNTPYDARWAEKKFGKPATQKFNTKVREIREAEGLQFDVAWSECRRRHPKLYGAMSGVNEAAVPAPLPKGVVISADGQHLAGEWPVSPRVLASMGLPLEASRDAFEIYRAAESVKELSPEVAAKILRTAVVLAQAEFGASFDAVATAAVKLFPDLETALKKLPGVTLAGNKITAANEAQSGHCQAIGPVFPFSSKRS